MDMETKLGEHAAAEAAIITEAEAANQVALKDMETKLRDSYHHMNSSRFGSARPSTNHDVVPIDDADELGETQVHLEVAQDGQPHNMVD